MNCTSLIRQTLLFDAVARRELIAWIKTIFTTGLWAFFPVWIGVLLGYGLNEIGLHGQALKAPCEVVAIWLMSAVVILFLYRVVRFRQALDIAFLILGVGFLCREIHFSGTDTGVYVVALIAFFYGWSRRNIILAGLSGRPLLKTVIFCMIWSYAISILIQRRVFRHILPSEQAVHIGLEEITENVAHLFFGLVALTAFLPAKKTPDAPPAEDGETQDSSAA